MTYELKFISDNGVSVGFGFRAGIVVEDLSDATSQNISMTGSQGVDSVGVKLEDQTVQPKNIAIQGVIKGRAAEKRALLLRAFAPRVGGTLVYDNKYQLRVYPTQTPVIEKYEYNPAFNLTLYAPYPYWRAMSESSETLLGVTKEFRFPWNISTPYRFGSFSEKLYVNVTNLGNVPARWKLSLFANADLANPMIQNMKTAKLVRVLKTMTAGEQLTIDFTGQELTVSGVAADGTPFDAFEYLDIDSEPFELAVGDNLIKVDADNRNALVATLSFSHTVSGVWLL